MATVKKRFFKRSKETTGAMKAQKVSMPKPSKQLQPMSTVTAIQSQKQANSVINREIFGNSKAFLQNIHLKWGIIGALIIMGLLLNFFAIKMLLSAVKDFEKFAQNREKLSEQLYTWESITKQYPNYRDAYVEGALYAYQLGDRGKEEYFLSKLQLLDPNFPLTKTLERLTNLQDIAN